MPLSSVSAIYYTWSGANLPSGRLHVHRQHSRTPTEGNAVKRAVLGNFDGKPMSFPQHKLKWEKFPLLTSFLSPLSSPLYVWNSSLL